MNRKPPITKRWLVLFGGLLYAVVAGATFAVLGLVRSALEGGWATAPLPPPLSWMAHELPTLLPVAATLWLAVGGAMILLGGFVLRPTSG